MRTRLARRTTTAADGTRVTKTKLVTAPELEWKLQAAAVKAARAIPGFGNSAAPGVTFTLAGDFNAGRRGMQESVKAKATGLVKGEADLRLYFSDGRLKMIEYKAARGRLSPEQVVRHELFRHLGFEVVVIKAETEAEAAERTVEQIRAWLAESVAANDNGVRE